MRLEEINSKQKSVKNEHKQERKREGEGGGKGWEERILLFTKYFDQSLACYFYIRILIICSTTTGTSPILNMAQEHDMTLLICLVSKRTFTKNRDHFTYLLTDLPMLAYLGWIQFRWWVLISWTESMVLFIQNGIKQLFEKLKEMVKHSTNNHRHVLDHEFNKRSSINFATYSVGFLISSYQSSDLACEVNRWLDAFIKGDTIGSHLFVEFLIDLQIIDN